MQKEQTAGKTLQAAIISALHSIGKDTVYKNRSTFTKVLHKAFKAADLTVKPPVIKAILTALGEKDESADICTNSKGSAEPDPDLRDTEYIPVKQDIQHYMRQEVLPYTPDAWIDDSKTKKGYEIPFTRYFYRYEPIGNAEQTRQEIQNINTSIQEGMHRLFEGAV